MSKEKKVQFKARSQTAELDPEVTEFLLKLQILKQDEEINHASNTKAKLYSEWKLNKRIVHEFHEWDIFNEIIENSRDKPLEDFERLYLKEISEGYLCTAHKNWQHNMTISQQRDRYIRNRNMCGWYLYLIHVEGLGKEKAYEKLATEYGLDYDHVRKEIINKEYLKDECDQDWVITVLDKIEGVDVDKNTLYGHPLNCY